MTWGHRHLTLQRDIHSNNQQAENIHFIEMEMVNAYIAQHAGMQNQIQIEN